MMIEWLSDFGESLWLVLRLIVGAFFVLVFVFLLVYSASFAFHAGRRAGSTLNSEKHHGEE